MAAPQEALETHPQTYQGKKGTKGASWIGQKEKGMSWPKGEGLTESYQSHLINLINISEASIM